MDLGNIEYIRVWDGTTVPNGKYNLELAADQSSEIRGSESGTIDGNCFRVEMAAGGTIATIWL